jgi:hypothetical protein
MFVINNGWGRAPFMYFVFYICILLTYITFPKPKFITEIPISNFILINIMTIVSLCCVNKIGVSAGVKYF